MTTVAPARPAIPSSARPTQAGTSIDLKDRVLNLQTIASAPVHTLGCGFNRAVWSYAN